MQSELKSDLNKPNLKSRKYITVLAVLAIVVVLVFLIIQAITPNRSVAGYCKVYKQEKIRLAKLPGDTYPSLLFDHPLSDAGEFAASLDRLEKVAPNDVKQDISTLKSLYKKLDNDPSQMVSVSLAAEPVDQNISKWTNDNCETQ